MAESQGGQWHRLENHQWRNIYDTAFVPGYSDLRLVTSKASLTIGIEQDWTISYHWPLEISCGWEMWDQNSSFPVDMSVSFENGIQRLRPNAPNHRAIFDMEDAGLLGLSMEKVWPKFGNGLVNVTVNNSGASIIPFCDGTSWLMNFPFKVDYALAKPMVNSSKVQFALLFMLIVIFANILKVVTLFMTLRICSSRHNLTLGDAIASFMEYPEEITLGQCTTKRYDLLTNGMNTEPRPWKRRKVRLLTMLRGNLRTSGLTLYVMF